MNREKFKNEKEFNYFVHQQKEMWLDAGQDSAVDAFEIFGSDIGPDKYPCILIWCLGELEMCVEVDHEYIYKEDFNEEI